MPDELAWRVARVRLFLAGHDFDYIDNALSLADMGDVLGYWSGESKAKERLQKQAQAKQKRSGGRGRGRRR